MKSSLYSLQRKLGSQLKAHAFGGDASVADEDLGFIDQRNSKLSARRSVEVYAEGYVARVCESMEEDLPLTLSYLGEARFKELCRDYVMAHPSRSQSLADLTQHWVSFAESRTENLGAPLLDIARLEMAQVKGIFSKNVGPVSGEFSEATSEIILQTDPSLNLLKLGTDLLDLWANRGRHYTKELVSHPRPMPYMIYRELDENLTCRFWFEALSETERDFFETLSQPKSLEGVIGELLERHPPEALQPLLTEKLPLWRDRGAVHHKQEKNEVEFFS